METNKHPLAIRLTELREEKGLSLTELGAMLGVTTACVSYWESGKTFPRPDTLKKIADCLKTSVEYLLTGQSYVFMDLADSLQPHQKSTSETVMHSREAIARALNLDVDRVHIMIDRSS